MSICTATRKNGQPCAAQAVAGFDQCSFHKGDRHATESKLTPELTDKLVQLLKAGNYTAVAVRACGISRALFYQWLDRGASDADEDIEYAELRERVELAKAEGEARNVAAIANAARENWQAAAWLLERQYPDRWGRSSVRLRDAPEDAQQVERSADPDDPFAEVDQLAEAPSTSDGVMSVSERTVPEVFESFCTALVLEDGRCMQLEPFQRTLLRDYFDGVIETLVLLSKKNGKTTLLSALALFHLLSYPGEAGAECVIAASSRDQATILYDQAVGFIRRTPGLASRVVAKRGYREIRSLRNHGRVRVLAADVDHVDGVIPTLALVDEMHRHKSAELYGLFRDGLGPRNGQMLTISTAGDNEQSALGLMRTAALRLPELRVEGKYTYARSADGSYALHEWALDKDDDLDDMELVKQANPASWQTPKKLRKLHDSPSMLPWQWARFRCGVWMEAEAYWIDGEEWHAGETLEKLKPKDRVALGFDGSRFGDATALVACRLSDGLLQLLDVWQAPEHAPPDWEVPEGEVDAAVHAAMTTYRVARGYFDPPLWQSEIDAWSRDFGDTAVMRFHTNRSRMMEAVERFRTDIAANRIPHVYDDRLSAHVLSAQTREVRNGYWLAKNRNDKIDAAVAAVLAYEARCDATATPERSNKLVTW